MIKNYIKTALRNINKHKFFAGINILGLTVGIAGCLLITLYVYDELTYDNMHVDGELIYRAGLDAKLGEQEVISTNTPARMSKYLNEEVAIVERATFFQDWGDEVFRDDDKILTLSKVYYADSNFLQIFTFPLIEGDKKTALKEPNTLVLSKSTAAIFFENESAMGKLLTFDGKSFKVTGICEDFLPNSHLKFNVLISAMSYPNRLEEMWLNNSYSTYYKVHEGVSSDEVDEQLEAMVQKYISPVVEQMMGGTVNQLRETGGRYSYFSEPLGDIHLYSKTQDGTERGGNIAYVYILIAIGTFILVLACINFMNLSTAKSAGRAKEVGLRKTLGSSRKQLITQFLTETMIYAVIAAILALLMVYVLMPSFNLVSGKMLQTATVFEPVILISLVLIVIFVGLLAGSYPAFYLTSFEVTEVIKGKIKSGTKSKGIRSFLVTFQFWISIILIISTAFVYMQLEYVQSKELGLAKEEIVYVHGIDRLGENQNALKQKLDKTTGITSTSFTSNTFPGSNNNSIFRKKGSNDDFLLGNYRADYDHLSSMGFELTQGRFFSRDFATDSMAIVINEQAVKEMGFEEPLGKIIRRPSKDGEYEHFTVIGVIKDFNFESLRDKIRPICIFLSEKENTLAVRFQSGSPQKALSAIEEAWISLAPNEPFDYSFMSDDYDELFRSEQRLGQIFTSFTALAIFIACLGLFGLTAFTAEQRTKEIGVRKALGASLWELNTLLSREFTKLVLLAFALAIFPVYYIMSSWLENFAYRIQMQIWVFAVGGILSLVIAWVTVTYQAQKAARANPVKALKYE